MKYIILITTFLLFSGCDKYSDYELFKSDGGKIYRLNKKNGDVAVIEGNHLIDLKEQSDIPISKAKIWPTFYIPSLDGIQLTFRTSWRDGRMYYLFSTSSFSGKLKSTYENSTLYSSNRFTVELSDSGGFNLLEVPISLSSMTRIVNEKGEPLYLSINGSTPCPIETYFALDKWASNWNF